MHTSTNTSVSTVLNDAQQKNLEEAFEQVKYFVEDLDHANGNDVFRHEISLHVILSNVIVFIELFSLV